jgi:hypothetical protein
VPEVGVDLDARSTDAPFSPHSIGWMRLNVVGAQLDCPLTYASARDRWAEPCP